MKAKSSLVQKCKEKLLNLKNSYDAILSPHQEIHSKIHNQRIQTLLPEIEKALKRIEEGTYGLCEISGKRIEEKRLLAIPWTRVSIKTLESKSS